jgi:hypothetical protein
MITTGYAFRLRVFDPAGALIHSEEAREWGAAYEDLLFEAVLAGSVPNDGAQPPAVLEPLDGEGRVRGFRLSLGGFTREYSVTIVGDRVNQIVADAEAGRAENESGDARGEYAWEVVARRDAGAKSGRVVRVRREPYPLLDAPPAASRAATAGSETLAISAAVAARLRRAAAESTDLERAYLLAGWVARRNGGVVVAADRAYPVEAGVTATQTRIDFSPASFSAAVRELAREGGGRTPVGWAHNHPTPCGGPCPADRPPCDADSVFFSVDDRVVHRCYFRAPYMVAVVSGKGAGRPLHDPLQRAWSWSGGLIREIEFSTFMDGQDE